MTKSRHPLLIAAVICACCAMVSQSACAAAAGTAMTETEPLQGANPAQDSRVATAGDLARAQSRVAMLKADLEIARLQAEIRKVKEGKTANAANAFSRGPNPYQMPGVSPFMGPVSGKAARETRSSRFPRVISLSGMAGRYTAMIAMPNGTVMSAKDGTSLGDGWKIARIGDQGVVALRAGKRIPLAFVSSGSENEGSSSGMGASMSSPPSISPPMPGGPAAPLLGAGPLQGAGPVPGGE